MLTVDEANLKDGVLSRDLPEEPLLWPRMGVWPDILAGSSKTGFWNTKLKHYFRFIQRYSALMAVWNTKSGSVKTTTTAIKGMPYRSKIIKFEILETWALWRYLASFKKSGWLFFFQIIVVSSNEHMNFKTEVWDGWVYINFKLW